MLHLVHAPVSTPRHTLPQIVLRADRAQMAKRRWRGTAEDGTEFGFELEAPLKHGDTVFEADAARYVVAQEPEGLLEVSLVDLPASAAAGVGWAIGNLHLELCSEPSRLLVLDEPAVRQLLERLKMPYKKVSEVFRAGHFARGDRHVHELGHSHKH